MTTNPLAIPAWQTSKLESGPLPPIFSTLLLSLLSYTRDHKTMVRKRLWKVMVYHLSSGLIPKTHKGYSNHVLHRLPKLIIASYFTLSLHYQMFLPSPTATSPYPCVNLTLLAQRKCSYSSQGLQEPFFPIHYLFQLSTLNQQQPDHHSYCSIKISLAKVTNDLTTKSKFFPIFDIADRSSS